MKEAFVLVFGNIIQGTVLYGPFKEPGEVHDANMLLALPFYTVGSISYNSEEIDFNTQEDIFTIVSGNPFDGMCLNGLYLSHDEACEKADSLDLQSDHWYIVQLKNLEKILEELKTF